MKNNILVLFFFLGLIFLSTFPLVVNFNSTIPASFTTDESFSSLWDSWHIKYSFLNRVSAKKTSFIGFPFGTSLYESGYFSYSWMAFFYLLSILTNSILTYNIQIILNLLLCGIFTYFFVFHISRDKIAAFFSGIIFSFCPYQFIRAWQHLGLTYNEFIPLVLFSAILLRDRYSSKNILIYFISLFLLLSFEWTIMYMTMVSLAALLGYQLIYGFKNKFKQKHGFNQDLIYLKRIAIITLIAFLVLTPQFFPLIKNMVMRHSAKAAFFNPFRRPFEDLFAQSARPLSYFLPSSFHPLFGKYTEQFIGTSIYGMSFTEHTLYLGWIPLILAFVAFKKWKSDRKNHGQSSAVTVFDNKDNFYIGFFIFLSIVAWLFSQPPWWQIGPLKIYMPSFLMYKILPMFRAYCRFGIVVMLAISVLAGFGLKFILERFKTQRAKAIVGVLFSAAVLFEFWNWPPYKVINVSKAPAVYYWLKEQSKGVVIAEYPLDIDSPNETYKLYQITHEKKMINFTIPGTYAHEVAKTMRKLSDFKTTAVMKWMGVKYVLVHRKGYLETELIEDGQELDRIPQNKGLRFIKSFPAEDCPQKEIMCVQNTGPVDVYEITAAPVDPKEDR